MEEWDLEDWAKKCITCIHCYKKKNDDEYIYCRLKNGCRYETKKKNILPKKEQNNADISTEKRMV